MGIPGSMSQQRVNMSRVNQLRPFFTPGVRVIDEFRLAAPAATVTLAGFPQYYRTLEIEASVRSSVAAEGDNIYIFFNADLAANYDYEQLYGIGAGAGSSGGRGVNTPYIASIEGANSRANVFSPVTIKMEMYALADREKWAEGRSASFGDRSADADLILMLRTVAWRSQAAITSIRLDCRTGNFIALSRFTLYGKL